MRYQPPIRWGHLADQAASHDGPAWANVAVIGLRLTGWFAVTGLAAVGVVAMVAFALGGFSLPQTMLQLANLATRYVAADAGRQSQFNRIVGWVFWAALGAIAFFRRGSFVAAFRVGSRGNTQ